MGLLTLALVVGALLVLLLPREDRPGAASQPGTATGNRRRLVALLVWLGVLLLIAATLLFWVAYAGAHGDVGTTWANNAEARHARTISVLLALGGFASLVASRRIQRAR